jgi:subtilisin family serine protease
VVSLEDLSPDWAWGGSTGQGVRVAVVDSGIEADHPDLDGCVEVGAGIRVNLDASGEPVFTPGPHEDAFGHGTACAGIIHRLAPEARITSVRVLGAGLAGKANAFLAGLGWAIDQGFDVINLSLGTTKRDWALPFYEMCDRAYFGGSLLVTAANNMARTSYPSLYASVTSVACNLATDPFRFHYNPEPPTEFLAPGIDVEVSWRGGTRITGTGNSYAAPHLSGIATLIKAKHPELRPFQVKTVLWATAANVLEAPKAAGRLTSALQATRATRAVGRSTSAMRAVSIPPPP